MENVLSRNGLGSSWIIYDAKMKAPHPKALIQPPSREICDNLITLGCRRILVFLCFSKANNWRFVRAFRVPSRQPLDQIGWNSESMLSERSPTNRCLRILIIFLIKKLCLFFAGSSVLFFPFQTLSSCKKITNACAKNLRHGFWGQCVKKRIPCQSFSPT